MDRSPDRVVDEYLVLLCQAGSRAALGQLVARWSPRLSRYVARTLGAEAAEDIVQETWISALRSLRRLDDPARFPAWIYAIATARCGDAVRRAVRQRRLADRVAAEPLNGHAAPAGPAGLDLTAALSRLPMEQRLVVNLHYGEDLGVDEAAAVLKVPVGTVKSRLRAARAALKQILEGASYDEDR